MKKLFALISIAFALLLTGRPLFALTVTSNPNPANVGQSVVVNIEVELFPTGGTTAPPPTSCEVLIDYGDGQRGSAGICRQDPICNLSVTHRYAVPGNFNIRAWVNQSRCNRYAPDPMGSNEEVVLCRSLSFASYSPLPSGEVGKSYSYRLAVTGGEPPVTYNLVGGQLPPGLALSSSGLISGIPAAKGTYSFRVRATDSCPMGRQNVERTFQFTINEPVAPPPPPPPPPAECPQLRIITASPLPSGTVGKRYSQQISTSGGQPPITFSLQSGRLPDGVSLSSSGLISGVPTRDGQFAFTIMATDSCPSGRQRASHNYTIRILPPSGPPAARQLTVSVTPNHVTIPRGMPSQLGLVYSFSGDHDVTADLSSATGTFLASGRQIGSVPVSLLAHVRNGRATLREHVSIPVAILKRAERLGTTRFFYTRRFSNKEFDLTAQVEIVITTEAAAPFRISRLQLYFENNRAEITISQGQPSPKLFAEIRYVGTGLLKGFWEIDGRPLSTVFKHITYGRSIVLELPATTPLPTFEPGIHRVRFVITSPKFDAKLPVAVYYITAKSYKVKRIKLLEPENGAGTTLKGLSFSWKPLDHGAFAYLIEFRQSEKGKPLYSAYVKTNSYKVPPQIAVRYFSTVKKLLWQVKGFSKEGELIGKSPVWKLKMDNKGAYVPDQVVITWKKEDGDAIVSSLQKGLGIKLLYKFDLGVVNQVMGVFSTQGQDVEKVVKKAETMPMVRSAGPNYIFSLLGEKVDPLVPRQSIFDTLDISALRSLGGEETRVAIIDTGVDVDHPELKDCVKEKGNFIHGEKFQAEIHGTAVAGIIGAKRNGSGVEGISQHVAILALRACRQLRADSPEGQCFTDSIARALNHAIEKEAKVVNMSLGAYVHDKTLEGLIDEGASRGIIFVAPVGNDPQIDELPFPANLKDVIAVGGLNENGSMFPSRKLCAKADILAPHEKLLTTVPKGHFNFLSGTSMSTAIVSGLFALNMGPPQKVNKRPLDLCGWLRQVSEVAICKSDVERLPRKKVSISRVSY